MADYRAWHRTGIQLQQPDAPKTVPVCVLQSEAESASRDPHTPTVSTRGYGHGGESELCCMQAFQVLAQALPKAKHVHSKLVCYVTGQVMDEHNLPMVMPNGTVHSEAAVPLLTSPDGRTFTCPKSGAHPRLTDPAGSELFQIIWDFGRVF